MTINKTTLLKSLHAHADTFLKENFDMSLNIPIKINGRLRSTGGRFMYQINRVTGFAKSIDIEIAKFICENATIEEIFHALEHECVHYALFERGEPCADSDRHFIETCKRLNVCLTHNIDKEKFTYICPECGVVTERNQKIPKGYYTTCKDCGGKITKEHLVNIKSMKIRQII